MNFLTGYTFDFRNEEDLRVIEIVTLDELLEFVSVAENAVIIRPPVGDECWELEIYDDYRE